MFPLQFYMCRQVGYILVQLASPSRMLLYTVCWFDDQVITHPKYGKDGGK
jgi:hypothetical protein